MRPAVRVISAPRALEPCASGQRPHQRRPAEASAAAQQAVRDPRLWPSTDFGPWHSLCSYPANRNTQTEAGTRSHSLDMLTPHLRRCRSHYPASNSFHVIGAVRNLHDYACVKKGLLLFIGHCGSSAILKNASTLVGGYISQTKSSIRIGKLRSRRPVA